MRKQFSVNQMIKKYNGFSVQMRASFWFLICAFLQKGVSVLSTPIFTRLLSASEYGQYNVFSSWLSVATIFVSLCLTGGVYTQGLVKYESERKQFSSSLQGLTTVFVSCWVIIYLLFRNFWNALFSLTTLQMLAMLVMIWTTAVFNFWANEQRGDYKYRTLVILTICVTIAQPVIGIIFVANADDKVTARIVGIALVELIGYTALYFIQMFQGRKFFVWKFWKHALAFNIPLIPHYLSQTVLNSADRIMIAEMVGDNKAGIYSLAYSVACIMLLFNTALMQTVSPWIYQKIKAEKIYEIESIAYITLIIIAVVNLFLIIFAPEIVAIFAPRSYYEAIWIIPPVAMSVYFMYLYDLFAKIAFYYEKTIEIMLVSVFGAALNIVLNFVFIRQFGYIAAGYTTLVCYIVYSMGHYIFMNRICRTHCDGKTPYNLKKILAITILFLIAGFILLFTYKYIVIRYGIVFMVILWGVARRKLLIKIIRKLLLLRKQEI